MKLSIIPLVFMIVLSGCAAYMDQIMPVTNKITPIESEEVVYILNDKSKDNKLKFAQKTWNYRAGNVERGFEIKEFNDKIIFKRFISDSINEYVVSVKREGNKVTYKPVQNRINKLIGGPDVPDFPVAEIVSMLSNTTHKYKFEVSSKYPSESINGNFARLLTRSPSNDEKLDSEKIYKNKFILDIESVSALLGVNTYPYRNGSRSSIFVKYYTEYTNGKEINLAELENKIKIKVKSIVDS